MTLRTLTASFAVGVLVLIVVWLSDLSLERAALLAPVLVIGVAAVAGLAVFWGRVLSDSVSRSRRPRLVVSIGVACIGVLLVLSLLGVKLPHE
jgi:hypothetical protein